MGTIRIHTVIKRPKKIVQTALLEGLSVHKDVGNIIEVTNTMEGYLHYVALNPSLCPDNFSDISILIKLSTPKRLEEHTYLESILKYSYPTKYTLKKILRKTITKQYIRFEILNTFCRFKYKVEKWL